MTEVQIAMASASMMREMNLTTEERLHVLGMAERLTEIFCECENTFIHHTGDKVRSAFVVRCGVQVALKIFKEVSLDESPGSPGGEPTKILPIDPA